MTEKKDLPSISRQISELILSGSTEHAEEVLNDTVEKFGDVAVIEVLDNMEPQAASLHLSAFDGGKLSLATLLVSPKAWAESLAYFAASWGEDTIEDEPEILAESLFAHIHGLLFAGDDLTRRVELIREALATDWGVTAFAVLFSTAPEATIELANEFHDRGVQSINHTNSDHDVIPLAIEIAGCDEDAWDRVLFELFPDWHPGASHLRAATENDEEDDEDDAHYDDESVTGRSTKELLLRLRKQVPTKIKSKPTTKSTRPSLGEDIFE